MSQGNNLLDNRNYTSDHPADHPGQHLGNHPGAHHDGTNGGSNQDNQIIPLSLPSLPIPLGGNEKSKILANLQTFSQNNSVTSISIKTKNSASKTGLFKRGKTSRSALNSNSSAIIAYPRDNWNNHDSANNFTRDKLDINFNTKSSINEFQNFQESIKHPLFRLGLDSGPSPFDGMIEILVEGLSELEATVEEIIRWRDEVGAIANVPSLVKLELTILVSKLFRSKSDLHQPLFDLISQTKLYSKQWLVNRTDMLELEKDYFRHFYVLDVAIRKLKMAESRVRKIKAQHNLTLWQKFALRVLSYIETQEKAPESITPLCLPTPITTTAKTSMNTGTGIASQLSSNNLKFKKLEAQLEKHIIGDTILDSPIWRHKPRVILSRFRKILNMLHPGWKTILDTPWIKRKGIQYLSASTGTCRRKQKKYPPLTTISLSIQLDPKATETQAKIFIRSASLPDLGYYYRHHNQTTEYKAWMFEKLNQPLDDCGVQICRPGGEMGSPLRRYARANSCGAVDELEKVIGDLEKKLDQGGEQLDQMGVVGGIVDDTDVVTTGKDKEQEEIIEPDVEYFKDIMSIDDKAAILKLVSAFQEMEIESMSRDVRLDENHNTFDLSQVMELTLLHAQQLHVVKLQAEQREAELIKEMEELRIEKDAEIELLKSQSEIMEAEIASVSMNLKKGSGKNDRSNSIPNGGKNDEHDENLSVNYRASSTLSQSKMNSRRGSAAVGTRAASTNKRMSIAPLAGSSRPSSTNPSIKVSVGGNARGSSAAWSDPIEQEQETIKEYQKEAVPMIQENPKLAANPDRGPRFNSVPFTLSFFERLDYFAKASVRYHTEQRLAARRIEQQETEKKLAYQNLISEDDKNVILANIPAEFMPMPGNLPQSFKPYRDTSLFNENGPWGGRFKIAEKAHRLNIMNLFDMSLTIAKRDTDSQDSNSEDEE